MVEVCWAAYLDGREKEIKMAARKKAWIFVQSLPVVDEQNKYCKNNCSVHSQGKLAGHCQEITWKTLKWRQEIQHPVSSHLPVYICISLTCCSFTIEGVTVYM